MPGTRPLIAALLSAVLPGAGHLYAGERRRGWLLVALGLVLLVPAVLLALLVLYVTGPGLAVTVSRPFFEHPGLLLGLLAINVLVGVFRVLVVLDAYVAAGLTDRPGSGWRHAVAGVVTVVLVAGLLVGPHYWAGRRNLAVYDLFTHDFVTPQPTTTLALPATTVTTQPPATSTSSPPGSSSSTTVPPTTTSSSIVVTPTIIPSSPFEGTEEINVLLMGGDAGPDRTGIRTDSMIVASIDPVGGHVALFGIPRNFKVLPVPEWLNGVWQCDCYEFQSNTIYQYGLMHPEVFPGGANTGGNAAKAVLGALLGIDIHYFALVDLLGFIDVIDAIGGVTITVTSGVYDELYTQPDGDQVPVSIPPGTYHMDGETALAFARVRRGQSDYERMDRQRCVLEALATQADPLTVLRELPYLVPAVEGSLYTDIPVADWPDILEFLGRTDTEHMVSVRFIPSAPELAGTGLSYIDGHTADGFGIPNVELIQSVVADVIAGRDVGAGIPTLDEACG